MGLGTMSTPKKPNDAGLDNVSLVLYILDYLSYILDGRLNRGPEHSTERLINRVRRGAKLI